MKEVVGSTANEIKLIKSIQKGTGALDNGVIGCQTLSDLAIALGCNCFPLTLKIYGCPTIIAKDVVICDPDASIKSYGNSISGSFTWPPSDRPCSILVNNGKDIFSYACHQHNGYPEGVIARYNNGTYWQGRCKNTGEIPNRADVDWAVGGLSLLDDYNPAVEGFIGTNSDVLRKTNHTVIGVKNRMCYLVYVPNMTGSQIQNLCNNKMKFDMALLLDGGHIAAINGSESFARINLNLKQGYMIQGV